MTLPIKDQKLSKEEVQSIEIAIEESGVTAIHPSKMEAFAQYMVEKMKIQNK
tara:strand:+ start:2474 stop:2629 length:156 start_codon:yes stop_codon:yes gene_type:complete